MAYGGMAAEEVLPAPVVTEYWLPDRLLSVRRPRTEGRPALLVHGLGGNSLNWTDLSYQLTELDTYAVDLPGFGASPPPRDGDYSPQGYAAALAEFVREIVGEPVDVFGNSLGGAVSVQLAARYPDLVKSLTLVSPAMPGNKPNTTNVYLPVVAVPGLGERIIKRFANTPAAARVDATIRTCYADPSTVHPQRLAEAIAEVERRDHLDYIHDAFLQALRGLLRTMLDKGPQRPLRLCADISAPTLLFYGKQDKLVDSKLAYKVGNAIPNSRVVHLPNTGHVAQMENPVEVANYWRDLIGSRD